MKTNFTITLIIPKGYIHSQAFIETSLLLKYSLQSIGYKSEIKINSLNPENINIILGYHLLKYSPTLKTYAYIPYQLEQLHKIENDPKLPENYFPNMLKILKNATAIWDYSPKNIKTLKKYDLEAKLLIPGYHKNLEIIKQKKEKNIDILFYGSIDKRRQKIKKEFEKIKNLKTLFVENLYGEKRNKLISESKIILNIHKKGEKLFEPVRISFLLNNKCLILSEKSTYYPYKKVKLPFACPEELVEKAIEILSKRKNMEKKTEENYLQYKAYYPMTKIMKKILKQTLSI